VRAARRAEIDAIPPARRAAGRDGQQLVAATAAEECDEDQLFALVRRAAPYAELARADFDAVIDMAVRGHRPPAAGGRARSFIATRSTSGCAGGAGAAGGA
jgi:ATP-dependent Lhr-like helicase